MTESDVRFVDLKPGMHLAMLKDSGERAPYARIISVEGDREEGITVTYRMLTNDSLGTIYEDPYRLSHDSSISVLV